MEIYVYDIGNTVVELDKEASIFLEETNGMTFNESETMRRREVFKRVEALYDVTYDSYFASGVEGDEETKAFLVKNFYSRFIADVVRMKGK